ncbi:sugar ABC transporter substrate-binding protein [Paraburkholderia unamae]|uniref:Monosaccharide ABC transporter substrate-binding protein (CUT2 family) n=1 Tax=Paraburkholderia unamae TaxID=219649 RepID=A0ABX5KHL7_9BURK|nr:sugar ABC transporter substrate-binding protein [Paraburkholderia unamae]PVX79827.1 monosaccharide ABC transporter substrate-binding protein (CUT2 family) [Paraburkholderia unamae]RAR54981.1 monosaccharide ABC transporter substrate-binding protein (CUT2 family) [Paraburkholderia unamae]CAG9271428.1 Ribose ABC transport system, periplasmic ribose-binding protein RbsB (TC 3.A.1.2.1) [Paraburkholderia unamae]
MSSFDRSTLSRRQFMKLGAGAAVAAASGGLSSLAFGAQPVTLACSFRSLTSPYYVAFNKGAQNFAKNAGLSYVPLTTEGSSEKGIADVRALLQKTGGNLVLNVDPNDSADARVIVEACAKAGAFVTTIWNKPKDLHPWDYNPNYVAHLSFDGVANGEATATELFKSMGGKGGVVALGGIFSNVPAIERKAGLMAALKKFPGIELLDFQVADWDSQKAFPIMQAWLTRFNSKIKGVWAANDDMALGAIEALRGEGLAGQLPVSGMDGDQQGLAALKAGEMNSTVYFDPYWLGGIGLSMGLEAKQQKLQVASLSKDKREMFCKPTLVTKANVQQVMALQAAPTADWNNLYARVAGPVVYR